MSDITSGRDLTFFGPNRERVSMTLLAGQKVYQGGFAAVKTDGANIGKLVGVGTDVNSADGYSKVVGVFSADYDASSPSADLTVLVRPMKTLWLTWVPNSTSSAVTATSVGSVVYCEDNGKATTSGNTKLGTCWGVSSTEGVLVEIGVI